MFKIVTATITLALLVGCTSKNENALMEVYEKDKTYHRQLLKTQKVQLYEDKVTKVLFTATYMHEPRVNKKEKKDEVFVVGLSTEENMSEGLTQGEFRLTLDGVGIKNIKALAKEDPLLKDISFVSEWGQFYLVQFPHTNKKRFNLILSSKKYGKGTLPFAKVAKYVFTVKDKKKL